MSFNRRGCRNVLGNAEEIKTSNMKTVYLAGPITGQTYGSSTTWREEVKSILKSHNIHGLSPMRGKAYLSAEDKLKDSYEDKTMSSIVGINVRDFNDCKTCDAILVNFLGAKRVSIGTVMEIAWARLLQKPIVIIIDDDNIHQHGMLTFGNILVKSIDEGIDAIIQLLGQKL